MKIFIILILLNFIFANQNINNLNNFNESNNDITKYKNKNLLLSIIVKYSWEKILPFLKSFIKINSRNCDIVFFVNQVTPEIISNLKSYGVIVHEIKEKLIGSYNIYKTRWKLYRDFLNDNKSKYNIVLSVDIRDTIFQKEFFSLYENYSSFIGFSYESATINKLIKKEDLINAVGIDNFKSIENKRTLNAGTVWATSNIFCEFADILYNKLLEYTILDQCLVNYLIYKENILNNATHIYSDEYGPVLTLGLTNKKTIKIDYDENILNYKGEIALIVHQYDRDPLLKKIMRKKFCPELYNNKYIEFLTFLEIFTIILLFKTNYSLYQLKKEKIYKI